LCSRKVSIVAVQGGPSSNDKNSDIKLLLQLFDEAMSFGPADYVCFSELCTTPYFCGILEPSFFDLAETIPGPTTNIFAEKAKQWNVNVILPIFERSKDNKSFYNSVVFLDRNGKIIPGKLPNGETILTYSKCHIPTNSLIDGNIEKYYFKPGKGFPVFNTDKASVGCLVCYDRSFPEAWRVSALLGAEIIFVPVCTSPKNREDSFLMELQVAALQNGLFIVTVNKTGKEIVGTERNFFGKSSIINPFGEIITLAGDNIQILRQEIDMDDITKYSKRTHFLRDRRPELYSFLVKT